MKKENELEKRVSILEKVVQKVGTSTEGLGEALVELASGVSEEIRLQVKEEMTVQKEEIASNVVNKVNALVGAKVENEVAKQVDEKVDKIELRNKRYKAFLKYKDRKIYDLLGKSDSDKYQLFRKFVDPGKSFFKHFNVSNYKEFDYLNDELNKQAYAYMDYIFENEIPSRLDFGYDINADRYNGLVDKVKKGLPGTITREDQNFIIMIERYYNAPEDKRLFSIKSN